MGGPMLEGKNVSKVINTYKFNFVTETNTTCMYIIIVVALYIPLSMVYILHRDGALVWFPLFCPRLVETEISKTRSVVSMSSIPVRSIMPLVSVTSLLKCRPSLLNII